MDNVSGCKVYELQVGDEFSHDEGKTWGVAKKIVYFDDDTRRVDIWVQPSSDPAFIARYHVTLDEYLYVHFPR